MYIDGYALAYAWNMLRQKSFIGFVEVKKGITCKSKNLKEADLTNICGLCYGLQ